MKLARLGLKVKVVGKTKRGVGLDLISRKRCKIETYLPAGFIYTVAQKWPTPNCLVLTDNCLLWQVRVCSRLISTVLSRPVWNSRRSNPRHQEFDALCPRAPPTAVAVVDGHWRLPVRRQVVQPTGRSVQYGTSMRISRLSTLAELRDFFTNTETAKKYYFYRFEHLKKRYSVPKLRSNCESYRYSTMLYWLQ